MYGAEAGSGGNVPWYSGSFVLTSSVQDYSFQTFMTQSNITGSLGEFGIEVKEYFIRVHQQLLDIMIHMLVLVLVIKICLIHLGLEV